jgi:adenylate kinase
VRVVLLGAPGSGKGTQGTALAKELGVPLVSSGQMLRDEVSAGSDRGHEVAAYLDRGDLVPDDLVVGAVRSALSEAVKSGGYVLDGFPRTVAQARRVDEDGAPDAVIYLAVPDDVVRRRLDHRADVGRADDDDQSVIDRRLRHFHEEVEPMLDYYRGRNVLTTIDADQPPEAVHEAIVRSLRNGRDGDG